MSSRMRSRSSNNAGIVEMALLEAAPTMGDHRAVVFVAAVSALSLQSSMGGGRDGAIRWSGSARRQLHVCRDVCCGQAAEVDGCRDEWEGARRDGPWDWWAGSLVPGGGGTERLAVRAVQASRERGCGVDAWEEEGFEGRSSGRVGSSERTADGFYRDPCVQGAGAS